MAMLVASVSLACAADDFSLKALNQKALDQALARIPLRSLEHLPQQALICAIPLKEIRAGMGKHIDPIALPSQHATFDRIAHPAPIQACPNH
jgi:hypothetical protein